MLRGGEGEGTWERSGGGVRCGWGATREGESVCGVGSDERWAWREREWRGERRGKARALNSPYVVHPNNS